MNTTPRTASLHRQTSETDIRLTLTLDKPKAEKQSSKAPDPIATGVGFFDHMLTHIAKHGRLAITVQAEGDTHIDDHHTVEDVGLALGEALAKALGDKRGIERYGHAAVPMDEALARVTLDLSGRPHLVFHVQWTDASGMPTAPGATPSIPGQNIRGFDLQLVREFFQAVANAARMNLHIEAPYGVNNHHLAEAIFKAFGRALRDAVRITGDDIPSTKGVI